MSKRSQSDKNTRSPRSSNQQSGTSLPESYINFTAESSENIFNQMKSARIDDYELFTLNGMLHQNKTLYSRWATIKHKTPEKNTFNDNLGLKNILHYDSHNTVYEHGPNIDYLEAACDGITFNTSSAAKGSDLLNIVFDPKLLKKEDLDEYKKTPNALTAITPLFSLQIRMGILKNPLIKEWLKLIIKAVKSVASNNQDQDDHTMCHNGNIFRLMFARYYIQLVKSHFSNTVSEPMFFFVRRPTGSQIEMKLAKFIKTEKRHRLFGYWFGNSHFKSSVDPVFAEGDFANNVLKISKFCNYAKLVLINIKSIDILLQLQMQYKYVFFKITNTSFGYLPGHINKYCDWMMNTLNNWENINDLHKDVESKLIDAYDGNDKHKFKTSVNNISDNIINIVKDGLYIKYKDELVDIMNNIINNKNVMDLKNVVNSLDNADKKLSKLNFETVRSQTTLYKNNIGNKKLKIELESTNNLIGDINGKIWTFSSDKNSCFTKCKETKCKMDKIILNIGKSKKNKLRSSRTDAFLFFNFNGINLLSDDIISSDFTGLDSQTTIVTNNKRYRKEELILICKNTINNLKTSLSSTFDSIDDFNILAHCKTFEKNTTTEEWKQIYFILSRNYGAVTVGCDLYPSGGSKDSSTDNVCDIPMGINISSGIFRRPIHDGYDVNFKELYAPTMPISSDGSGSHFILTDVPSKIMQAFNDGTKKIRINELGYKTAQKSTNASSNATQYNDNIECSDFGYTRKKLPKNSKYDSFMFISAAMTTSDDFKLVYKEDIKVTLELVKEAIVRLNYSETSSYTPRPRRYETSSYNGEFSDISSYTSGSSRYEPSSYNGEFNDEFSDKSSDTSGPRRYDNGSQSSGTSIDSGRGRRDLYSGKSIDSRRGPDNRRDLHSGTSKLQKYGSNLANIINYYFTICDDPARNHQLAKMHKLWNIAFGDMEVDNLCAYGEKIKFTQIDSSVDSSVDNNLKTIPPDTQINNLIELINNYKLSSKCIANLMTGIYSGYTPDNDGVFKKITRDEINNNGTLMDKTSIEQKISNKPSNTSEFLNKFNNDHALLRVLIAQCKRLIEPPNYKNNKNNINNIYDIIRKVNPDNPSQYNTVDGGDDWTALRCHILLLHYDALRSMAYKLDNNLKKMGLGIDNNEILENNNPKFKIFNENYQEFRRDVPYFFDMCYNAGLTSQMMLPRFGFVLKPSKKHNEYVVSDRLGENSLKGTIDIKTVCLMFNIRIDNTQGSQQHVNTPPHGDYDKECSPSELKKTGLYRDTCPLGTYGPIGCVCDDVSDILVDSPGYSHGVFKKMKIIFNSIRQRVNGMSPYTQWRTETLWYKHGTSIYGDMEIIDNEIYNKLIGKHIDPQSLVGVAPFTQDGSHILNFTQHIARDADDKTTMDGLQYRLSGNIMTIDGENPSPRTCELFSGFSSTVPYTKLNGHEQYMLNENASGMNAFSNNELSTSDVDVGTPVCFGQTNTKTFTNPYILNATSLLRMRTLEELDEIRHYQTQRLRMDSKFAVRNSNDGTATLENTYKNIKNTRNYDPLKKNTIGPPTGDGMLIENSIPNSFLNLMKQGGISARDHFINKMALTDRIAKLENRQYESTYSRRSTHFGGTSQLCYNSYVSYFKNLYKANPVLAKKQMKQLFKKIK